MAREDKLIRYLDDHKNPLTLFVQDNFWNNER